MPENRILTSETENISAKCLCCPLGFFLKNVGKFRGHGWTGP